MINMPDLLEFEDELEQRADDLDKFQVELEEEYAALQVKVDDTLKKINEADRMMGHYRDELRNINKYHPILMNQQYISEVDRPQDAYMMRLLPPEIDWDEQNDRALIKFTHGHVNGIPMTAVYALSMGAFDGIIPEFLEGIVKETAETINQELWRTVKERKNKNG